MIKNHDLKQSEMERRKVKAEMNGLRNNIAVKAQSSWDGKAAKLDVAADAANTVLGSGGIPVSP